MSTVATFTTGPGCCAPWVNSVGWSTKTTALALTAGATGTAGATNSLSDRCIHDIQCGVERENTEGAAAAFAATPSGRSGLSACTTTTSTCAISICAQVAAATTATATTAATILAGPTGTAVETHPVVQSYKALGIRCRATGHAVGYLARIAGLSRATCIEPGATGTTSTHACRYELGSVATR